MVEGSSTLIEKGPFFGIRHVQTLLLFFGIVSLYLGRRNVSVAVVVMTNAETTNPDFDEFDWTEKEKSYILSSFYWGYCLTQFPGGILGRTFGAKFTILLAVLVSTVLTLITPEGVRFGGWQMLCVIRFLQGLFQGPIFPCIHQHLAKWSPVSERTIMGALSYSGIECGTVLALWLSRIIAVSSLGWPGISYICVRISFVWCLLWFIFAADTPSGSRYISAEELKYIDANQLHNEDGQRIPVPWRAIFTSAPFIALIVARCAQAWGFTILKAEIPSYIKEVLQTDIKSNVLLSALPYLAMWIMSYVYGITADILLKKKILSLTTIRKLIISIAFWIPVVALKAIGFVGETQKTMAIILMTVIIGVNAGATTSIVLNSIDLSPNHAGILMAILNSIKNIARIFAPLTIGFIVSDETDKTHYQIVFIIASIFFIAGNIIYIIFGTAVTQPWNEPKYLKEDAAQNDYIPNERSYMIAARSPRSDNVPTIRKRFSPNSRQQNHDIHTRYS